MADTQEMIGYCGYNCNICAARSEDPNIRRKLVDGWRKYFGHQDYTVENVKCDGCKNNGKIADKKCQARPCATEKNIESCVDCNDFPCKKMKHLAASQDGMFFFCYPRTSTLTEEEYNLCMRQFVSMPTLLKKMVEKDLLPKWMQKYYK